MYWIPAQLSPPIPTDKEMLAIAIQDLKENAEELSKSENPIGGWRKAIPDQASAIDEYISIYHPILHHDTEAYTISQLNRPESYQMRKTIKSAHPSTLGLLTEKIHL